MVVLPVTVTQQWGVLRPGCYYFFVLPKRAATERVLIILDLVQTAASDGTIWEMLRFECVVIAALPVVVPPQVVPGTGPR